MGPEQIGQEVLANDIPPDVRQLRIDAINVLEGRIDINVFDPDYQEKMKDYYRFSAVRYGSRYGKIANRTINTLDIV